MSTFTTLALAGLATLTLVGTGCGSYVHDGPRPARRVALPVQACPAPIVGHGVRVRLPAGIYRCNVVLRGSGIVLSGSGSRRTIIEGDIIIRGSGNTVKRVQVRGQRRVAGVNNIINGKRYSTRANRRVNRRVDKRPTPRRHVYR